VLREADLTGKHLGNALDEGKALPFEEGGWSIFEVKLLQLRLVFEEFELGW